jgi:hypothetical protein
MGEVITGGASYMLPSIALTRHFQELDREDELRASAAPSRTSIGIPGLFCSV